MTALVRLEGNLTEGDPGLVAPEQAGFSLREDCPALQLVFQPVPFDKTGCTEMNTADPGNPV